MRRNPETHPQSEPPEELYTVSQIAKMFQVSDYTVRVWLKAGDMRGIKVGNGRWRVSRQELVRVANVKYGSELNEQY